MSDNLEPGYVCVLCETVVDYGHVCPHVTFSVVPTDSQKLDEIIKLLKEIREKL